MLNINKNKRDTEKKQQALNTVNEIPQKRLNVEIPEFMHSELRRYAIEHKTTLKALVFSALRKELGIKKSAVNSENITQTMEDYTNKLIRQ